MKTFKTTECDGTKKNELVPYSQLGVQFDIIDIAAAQLDYNSLFERRKWYFGIGVIGGQNRVTGHGDQHIYCVVVFQRGRIVESRRSTTFEYIKRLRAGSAKQRQMQNMKNDTTNQNSESILMKKTHCTVDEVPQIQLWWIWLSVSAQYSTRKPERTADDCEVD
jgi:hypothetical protein